MKQHRLFAICLMLLCMMLALSGCAQKEETPTAENNYRQAIASLQEGKYQQAAAAFSALGHYYDASEYALYCQALLSAAEGDYEQAAATFLLMDDFLDSRYLSIYYGAKALESEKEYELAQAQYMTIAQFRDAKARADQMPGLVLQRDYEYALSLEKNSQYARAISAYEELDGYQDSLKRIEDIRELLNQQAYAAADAQEKQGELESARAAFQYLGSYSDAKARADALTEMILARDYAAAEALQEEGDLENAYYAFIALEDYQDSADRALNCIYLQGKLWDESGDWKNALSLFTELGDYKDSQDCAAAVQYKIWDAAYEEACALLQNDDLIAAFDAFTALSGHRDAAEKAASIQEEAAYRKAFILANEGSCAQAKKTYLSISNYKDSSEKARLLGICDLSAENKKLSSGVIGFKLEDKWGLINLNENWDIAPTWNSISAFDQNGLAIAKTASGATLINSRGQEVLSGSWQNILLGQNGYYSALSATSSNNAYSFALISPQGKVLSDNWLRLGSSYNSSPGSKYNSAYLNAPSFTNGTIIAQNKFKTWQLLDLEGNAIDFISQGSRFNNVQSISYYSLNSPSDAVKVENQRVHWLFDLAGNPLNETGFREIGTPKNGYIRVIGWTNGLVGFLRQEDAQIAIVPQYEDARDFENGYAAVQVDGLWGFIDENNVPVIAPQYSAVHSFENDLCLVQNPSLGWQVIDRQGNLVYFKENAYAAASSLDEAGKYEEAIRAFEMLQGYSDSADRAVQAREKINTQVYASAEALEQEGKLLEAAGVFDWLGDYADSANRAANARETYYADTYASAKAQEDAGRLEEAIAIFLTLGDYNASAQHAADLREQINQGICRLAADLEAEGHFEDAIDTLNQIPEYEGVAARILQLEEKILQRDYQRAVDLENEGRFEEAIEALRLIPQYEGVDARILQVEEKILQRDYQRAADLEAEGQYAAAHDAFIALGEYSDSAQRAAAVVEMAAEQQRAMKYQAAIDAEDNGDYYFAQAYYTELGNYKDCMDRLAALEEKIRERNYENAIANLNAEKFSDAADTFMALGNYKDSASLLMQAQTGLIYQAALEDALNGNMKAAYETFVALGDYKDSAAKAEVVGNLSRSDTTKQIATGVLIFEFHDLWGIANLNTNVITPAKYTTITYDQSARYSQLGLLKVFISGGSRERYSWSCNMYDTYGYIDMNGKEVIPSIFFSVSDFSKDDLCTVALLRYEKYSSYSSYFYHRYYFSLMDANGKKITSSPWRTLGNSKNDSWNSYDSAASWDNSYCKIAVPSFSNGRMMVQSTSGSWGFIDESGKALGAAIWKSIGEFSSDGMAMVQDGSTGKYGFINEQGQTIGEVCWDIVNSFSNGYAAVQQNGKWGFINTQNQLVIPCKYAEVSAFKADGTCDVKTMSGTWQIIDTNGNVSFFGK
ncbi:MAG: hypothetical protein E7329_04270 [Clostridiales bacterium]|nr:hypothetical protein [Clostridiales bacterium]